MYLVGLFNEYQGKVFSKYNEVDLAPTKFFGMQKKERFQQTAHVFISLLSRIG